MNRAYSVLEIKGVEEDARVIRGIATSPRPDRVGDIVEATGIQVAADIPLFLYHDSSKTIGRAKFGKATSAGIPFEATLPKVKEAGALRDRVEEAWQMVTYGLLTGVSIGFRVLNDKVEAIKGGGYRFLSTEVFELSLVPIPAQPDAVIQGFKSADAASCDAIFKAIKSADQSQLRAASGASQARSVVRLNLPGASGKTLPVIPKDTEMKTIAEQISAFEAKRAASAGRMDEIMSKSAESGSTLDEPQTQEYDGLEAEVKTVDEHIVRLKRHEANMVSKATPITLDPATASEVRTGVPRITGVHVNLEKGIEFTRYVKALAIAKGNLTGALAFAEANQNWRDTSPVVAQVLKAAVAAGDTTTAGWASELVYNQNLVGAFLEYLRPKTIIGKIVGMTQVPFNVRWGSMTAGATGYWVGQGLPVPVSKFTTGSGSLGIAKAAGMIVLDQELIRSSAPSAELLTRNELGAAISQFLDQQFIAPDYAAVANVSPASVTNGVVPTAATGTTQATLRADVQTMFGVWIAANLDPTGGVWIMTPTLALSISLMLNALGQPTFPGMTMNGGTFMGLPVIVSNNAVQVGSPVSGEGNLLVLLHAPSIVMADDGQIVIDASGEASIQMLDNPTNQSTGSTVATTSVSMFQTNSVALRATRFINWSKRRAGAVVFVKDAAYVS